MANPGFIDGTVTVKGGTISYGYIQVYYPSNDYYGQTLEGPLSVTSGGWLYG